MSDHLRNDANDNSSYPVAWSIVANEAASSCAEWRRVRLEHRVRKYREYKECCEEVRDKLHLMIASIWRSTLSPAEAGGPLVVIIIAITLPNCFSRT